MQQLLGGCLCGFIRYRLVDEPTPASAGYCHCRTCQRSTGAPVVAWVTYPRTSLVILEGTPKLFQSSSKAERSFCEHCGTQLFFSYLQGSDTIDISLASLDDPAAIKPSYHIWTSQQVPWLKIEDDLPRSTEEAL